MLMTTHRKGVVLQLESYKSSSSLYALVESPVLAVTIVRSPTTFFLVSLRPVYQTSGIYRLEEEYESVPSFANIFFVYLYIL
jgi:hypothetical protein